MAGLSVAKIPAIHFRDADREPFSEITAAMDSRYGFRFAPARPAMTTRS
jgi:hypothetical protein